MGAPRAVRDALDECRGRMRLARQRETRTALGYPGSRAIGRNARRIGGSAGGLSLRPRESGRRRVLVFSSRRSAGGVAGVSLSTGSPRVSFAGPGVSGRISLSDRWFTLVRVASQGLVPDAHGDGDVDMAGISPQCTQMLGS